MKGLLFVLLFFAALPIWAGEEREIEAACAYLNDLLGENYPSSISVQCGFSPGDRKLVLQTTVASALKRAGLYNIPTGDFIISRKGYILEGSVVHELLLAAYEDVYPKYEIKIENLRFASPFYLTEENAPFELRVDTARKGSAQASLHSENMRGNLQYSVRLFDEGYILTDRAAKGEGLEGKLEFTKVDVTHLKSALVKEPEEIVAAKLLTKGQVLTSDMVSSKPDRLKGDVIHLAYQTEKMKIEIAVIAEADAVPGKNFLVRNPSTDKIFTVYYLGNGRARAVM